MKTRGPLLLVEDSQRQYLGLKVEIERAGWHIIHCYDVEQALYDYDRHLKSDNPVGIVALDLGLPPATEEPLRSGLKLAKMLRARNADLPILAYTLRQHLPKKVPYDVILAELLPLRISFLYLRRMENIDMGDLLELVWQYFVIFSPGPADYLPRAVPRGPDPFTDEDLWETLAKLAEGKSYKQIAVELSGIGGEGVRARINRIRDRLIDIGELEEYQREQDDLIRWYKTHYARYQRHKPFAVI